MAMTLLGLTVVFLCASFFSIAYWDNIVEPVVSITGAFINMLSLPVISMLLIVTFGFMLKNIRTR